MRHRVKPCNPAIQFAGGYSFTSSGWRKLVSPASCILLTKSTPLRPQMSEGHKLRIMPLLADLQTGGGGPEASRPADYYSFRGKHSRAANRLEPFKQDASLALLMIHSPEVASEVQDSERCKRITLPDTSSSLHY